MAKTNAEVPTEERLNDPLPSDLQQLKNWMLDNDIYTKDIQLYQAMESFLKAHQVKLSDIDWNAVAAIADGAVAVDKEELDRTREFTASWDKLSEAQKRIVEQGTFTPEEIDTVLAIRNGKVQVIDMDDISLASANDRAKLFIGEAAFSRLLKEQQEWSLNTFGPSPRTLGIIEHIRKELGEVEAQPYDLMEWVDIAILAIDGFWRHGGNPLMFVDIYERKTRKNFARDWPDWRTMSENTAIEHDRSKESV